VFGILLLLVIEHGLNALLKEAPHAHDHGHKDTAVTAKDVESPSKSEKREDGHGHACMAHDSTASWLKSAPVTGTVRAQVSCWRSARECVEKGCGLLQEAALGRPRRCVCATASTYYPRAAA
jgi:hypothetical protein